MADEIEVLGEDGRPIKVNAYAYAKKVGHGINIDNGDGTTTTYLPNGKTKTAKELKEYADARRSTE